jgi:hypothetical protein
MVRLIILNSIFVLLEILFGFLILPDRTMVIKSCVLSYFMQCGCGGKAPTSAKRRCFYCPFASFWPEKYAKAPIKVKSDLLQKNSALKIARQKKLLAKHLGLEIRRESFNTQFQ